MGIKDLSKVIGDHAENSIRQDEMKGFFGRKIAVDASMSMYQFLIAGRQDGSQRTNTKGEATSHLNGMFYRTIRMLECGIKPIYTFDGAPPEMKSSELDKRTERRAEAQKELEEALEKGDVEAADKQHKRLVHVTKEQNEQCKQLLRAMGVPVVEAPCEAEAQCAELVRKGHAFATATEDMDALTFGSTFLVRNLKFSDKKKIVVTEYSLEKILASFEMTMDQFIDLCILLGCDYCSSIRGIGQKKAFDLIVKYKSIESILENLDIKKYIVPENWNYAGARKLFTHPDVIDGDSIELAWTEPNDAEIIKILVEENNFNEVRVQTAIDRLKKTRQSTQQARIDSFFKVTGTVTTQSSTTKRKLEETKKGKSGKKKSTVPAKKKRF